MPHQTPRQTALNFTSVTYARHPESYAEHLRDIRTRVDRATDVLLDAHMYAPTVREALVIRASANLLTAYVDYLNDRNVHVLHGRSHADQWPELPETLTKRMVDIMLGMAQTPAAPTPQPEHQSIAA